MENKKIFDSWKEVDCENCERWWVNQCDGVKTSSEGSRRACNSYLATRRVVLPSQIKTIQRDVKLLTGALVILTVIVLFNL